MLKKILKFKNAIMWIIGIIILFWSNILATKEQTDTIDNQNIGKPKTTGNGTDYTPPPASAPNSNDKKETQGLAPEKQTTIKIKGTLKPVQSVEEVKKPVEQNTGDLLNETNKYLNQ